MYVQGIVYTQLPMSRMWMSLTLPGLCLPPNSTTLEQSTLMKLNAAQGGGRTPVVTGDIHSPRCTCVDCMNG